MDDISQKSGDEVVAIYSVVGHWKELSWNNKIFSKYYFHKGDV